MLITYNGTWSSYNGLTAKVACLPKPKFDFNKP